MSAYVNLPIVDVVAQFSDPGIDGLLMSTMRGCLGRAGLGEVLRVHAWPTVWVATGTVRLNVTWRVGGTDGRATDGEATISVLMVQSGREPITELLARLPVGADEPRVTTDVVHDLLDELTHRLEERSRSRYRSSDVVVDSSLMST
ncbi:MAG: hypothetical protein ACT452_12235 [Microthrixaceae bacterium]